MSDTYGVIYDQGLSYGPDHASLFNAGQQQTQEEEVEMDNNQTSLLLRPHCGSVVPRAHNLSVHDDQPTPSHSLTPAAVVATQYDLSFGNQAITSALGCFEDQVLIPSFYG